MFFSKSMAGGRHVGPPGETPKSPQSPEHVFGPEENKGTTVDTARNDAKLLFPSNFKHLLTHYPRFWAKSRQLESRQSRVGTNSLRAFGSNSHRPRRLWRPRATSMQSCFNQAQPSNGSSNCNCFWQKSFLGFFLRIFTANCKSTFLLLLVTKHPNSCAVKALITPQAQWCGFHRLHCALCLSSRPRKAQVMNRNLEIKFMLWRKANA